MQLDGSCHCEAVRFSVQSHEPVPFMRCYCSICRKTAGSGGFAINLGADNATLQVTGRVTPMMLGTKPAWVHPHLRSGDAQFEAYPKESLAQWHERLGQTR